MTYTHRIFITIFLVNTVLNGCCQVGYDSYTGDAGKEYRDYHNIQNEKTQFVNDCNERVIFDLYNPSAFFSTESLFVDPGKSAYLTISNINITLTTDWGIRVRKGNTSSKIYFLGDIAVVSKTEFKVTCLKLFRTVSSELNHPLYQQAYKHFINRKYDSAAYYYTKVINQNIALKEAYFYRGRSYLENRQYNSALADLYKAVQITSGNLKWHYYYRGITYYNLREYDEAIADYSKVIEADPDLTDALIERARSYIRVKKFELSYADFEKAISKSKKPAFIHNERGDSYYEQGKYTEAIKDYSMAIQLDPNYYNAFLNRSAAYRELKQFDEAIADCNQAIKISPQNKEGYTYRGNIYDRMRKYDLAIADAAKVIDMSPNYHEGYSNRGFFYDHTGEYELALKDFNQAIVLKPGFPNAYRGRGHIYFSKGEYESAINDLKKTISLKKDYSFAYLNLIFPLARLERFSEASDYYNQYLRLNSLDHLRYSGWNFIKYYIKAVCSYLPQGNYQQALTEIRQAEVSYQDVKEAKNATETSDYASVIALKAYVLEKLNRTDEAKDAYNQALAINPMQPEIKKSIVSLDKKESIKVQQDLTAPVIELISPQESRGVTIVSANSRIQVIGRAKDASGITTVTINGKAAGKLEDDGLFIADYYLKAGENILEITAADRQGNMASKIFKFSGSEEQKKDDEVFAIGKEATPVYYAILIGEENYQDPSIPDLQNPVKDARELQVILESMYFFKPANIDTLFNSSREEIMQAIVQRCNTLTNNDNLLVFYAGHGIAEKDKFGDVDGYWIPSSAKKGLNASYISADDINKALKRSDAKHILVVADACFSGAFTRQLPPDASLGIKKQYALPSRKVMASGNLEPVPDNSKFIYYLKKQLKNNQEKYITAKDLFDSFYKAILNNSENTPQYAAIKNVGDEGGEFIFIKK